jgi:PKD repeat protein
MTKHPTTVKRAGLLATALLALSCSESVGPGRGSPGAPLFSFSPNGITLHTDNGALGYSGRVIRKGFDHRDANGRVINPLPGDAVVATFYWITPTGNSSNIIASVRDVYTDATFTPIGNTYHLVDFITANGIAMATYVATNVQFDSTRGYVFAVEANFGDSIPDGGVKMTAWTGVEDVYPTALGSFHSTSLAASTPTPIAPGPITIGAGSLAYGVTLSNGGVNIASRPTGWTNVGGGIGSDGQLQDDGDYLPPGGGGSIDPQWTWDFQRASTALATVLELKPGTNGPPPNQAPTANFTSSCSGLNCTFTSTSSDPDGTIASYNWNFGDGTSSTLQNPSHNYTAGGSYTVTLQVTDNQGAPSAPFSRTITVSPANQPPTANFTFSCSGLGCTFTSTSSDPDGAIASYSWNFGDGTTSTVQNPSHNFTAGGSYTVTLQVTDNQGAPSAPFSRTVTVSPANQAPTADFTLSCSGLACTFTSTSSDPDGTIASYSWNFGDGTSSTLQNPSHNYTAGGTYTVTLTVIDDQGARSTPFSRNVTATPPNQAPTANFTFSCSGLGCTFTSTSSDPDGSIASYSWSFGDGATSTVQNPSHTYTAGGSYSVTLRVTDSQGAQSPVTTKTVTVTPPNQAPTANFTFSCSGLGCTFTSTSSDPDGSIASYSWNFGDGVTSTAQNPGHTYAAGGSYSVTLRVTDNQGAQSPVTSKTVTVTPPNQAPAASFTRSCSGLTCTFTSTSNDPDGSIAGYSWNFGDGATSTTANPSHTYATGGTYTVTLRVTDNQGAQSPTASQNVTVTPPNQAPTANFTFSCSALNCTFTSTSSDPDGTIASYSWNFGDGATSTAQNPSHSYTAGGTYTVTLRVTDNQGAQSATTSKTVTAAAPNTAPVVNAGPDQTAVTGLLYSTSVSFSDATPNGPWSYTINWGDGSTSTGTRTTQGAFTVGHTYVTILPRNYTITVTVKDAAGASGSDTKVVSVLLL